MAEERQRVEVVQSGWSTFWKWVGTIVVVLILAMVMIYIANTFLLGEKIRSDATSSDSDGGGVTLNIESGDSDGGGDASSDTNN